MAEAPQTTRDRLLEAARALFTTTGFHATTTPMIARHAGVAEGTIYRHFPSKEALLNVAYQEVQRWGATLVRDAGNSTAPTVGDRLTALGRVWLAAAQDDPARMRMLLGPRAAADLDDASRASSVELRQGLEHLIARGKQEGTVRAGVVELWTAVWLTLVSFAVEQVASREWTATHPHAIATLDAAWEAIAWRPIAVGAGTAPATDGAGR
ncbi:MAG TPA: TetR/AcrR family transcriptional regulator [Gemmatimonadales bacterium]|jgi:AcrR family transcriptional regulator